MKWFVNQKPWSFGFPAEQHPPTQLLYLRIALAKRETFHWCRVKMESTRFNMALAMPLPSDSICIGRTSPLVASQDTFINQI